MWNGIVAYLVMREARIRAMGPSAARAFANIVLSGSELTDGGRLAVMRAVAANIVRTQELHPNLVSFLKEVHSHVGQPPEAPLDDTRAFLTQLRELPVADQDAALMILSIGAVLDGRVNRRERKLIEQALVEAGRDDDTAPLERLRRMFARGEPIDADVVKATAPPRSAR
jgi:hypothetical protein